MNKKEVIANYVNNYNLKIYEVSEDYIIAGIDKIKKYKLYDGYNYGECKYFNYKGIKIYLNECIRKGTMWNN